MIAILAQASVESSTLATAWDVAQKVGSGGALVLIVVVYYLGRAYQQKDAALTAEVAYSKDRDKQTLTVMLELTALIRGMDKRDADFNTAWSTGTASLMAAIVDVKNTIREHLNSCKKPTA